VLLTYVWRNGATVVKTTSNTASHTDTLDLSVAGNGNKGQVISVAVTPSDGTVSGTAANASVTVVNSPPTLTNPGDRTNDEGDTVSLQLIAVDADGDSITYSASGLPIGLSASASGLISGFLGASSAGTYSTVANASDGTASGPAAFSWTVTNDASGPAMPAGLTSRTVGESIQLDWNDNTDVDFASYNVYRSATSTGTYTKLNTAPLTDSFFSDVTAPVGTSYYHVAAVDNLGNESASASITGGIATRFRAGSSATDRGTTSLVVPKPAGVVSGDVLLAQITIRAAPNVVAPAGWTSLVSHADGTALTQALFTHVSGSSEPASYTWTFSSPVAAIGNILAYSGVDPSAPVDTFGGQVNASATLLVAPSVTTTVAGDRLVALFGVEAGMSITPPTGMAERAEGAVSVGKSKVTSEAADESGGAAGITGNRTAQSSSAAKSIGHLVALRPATPLSPPAPTVPGSPGTPQASAGNAIVSLTWSAPGSNGGSPISGYKVYRRTSTDPEAHIASVSSTSFTDSGLTNGTTYFYRISAVNAVGEGAKSAEASATPAASMPPSAPRSLTAVTAKSKGTVLSWSAPSSNGGSAITGYRIYRGTSPGVYTLLGSVGVVTSYKDTAATRGSTFYYVVRAVNGSGEGPPSNEASAVAK
jgi:fibronectin type 3 domain-containing protein